MRSRACACMGLAGVMVGLAGCSLGEETEARLSSISSRLAAAESQLEVVNRIASSSAAVRSKEEGEDTLRTRVAFLERQLETTMHKAERANQRLNGLRLTGGEETAGQAYGCGGRDRREAPYVMVGLRDGAGCGSQNLNYYRELTIAVPPP